LIKKITVWGGVIAASIALDIWTKALAVAHLMNVNFIDFIPGLLRFNYVENTGAAFGMMKDKRWFFIIVSTVAIIAMILLLILRNKDFGILTGASLAMIIGGGIGNQIDRIAKGYVVDFLEFEFIEFPVFNVADSFITVGTILMLFFLIFEEVRSSRKKKKENKEN
jgi:signal peptidase II